MVLTTAIIAITAFSGQIRHSYLALSLIIARRAAHVLLTSVCFSITPAVRRTKPSNVIHHAPPFSLLLVPSPMLLCPLLALFLISYLTYAQPAEPSTKETGGPLLLSSGSPETGLDAGNLGSTIGGEGVIFPGPIGCSNNFLCSNQALLGQQQL